MRVIATAGHVDHGKSTLVRALTGRDPDRLAEEKRRGVTIELGFAWTDVPPVGAVAFVDVPGHERFVPTMLAGVGPVGAVLLVVAADEGWMPQSAEHLDILRLLDGRHGVVALTRADLVDDDTVELGAALVAEELAGSPLAAAPVVPVSAVTGQGLDELRHVLGRVLSQAPTAADRNRPRLWVDRSFTVRGAGTVVTGTLVGGGIAVGDPLVVHPAGPDDPVDVRVRGLQVMAQAVSRADPGSRVAINLSGADVLQAGRGSLVARADQWVRTTEVEVAAVPSPGRVIGRRGAWTVHIGTAAVPTRLNPVGGVDLAGPGPVRLDLAHPVVLAAGDRVVLRDAGPGGTAGGGLVLDPAPPDRPRGRTRRAETVAALAALAAATDPGERLAGLVQRHGHLPVGRALAMADADADDLAAAGMVELAGAGLLRARLDGLHDALAVAVRAALADRPALAALDRADARDLAVAAGAPTGLAGAVVGSAVAAGRLEEVPGGVRPPGHEAHLTPGQQAARARLHQALDRAGLEGLEPQDALAQVDGDGDLIMALRRSAAIRDVGGRLLGRDVVDAAVASLRDLESEVGAFTAAQARDALGATRRLVIPLLELTDATGHTIRDGDLRRVRPSGG